jgi:preprotein translocase subunit YajC
MTLSLALIIAAATPAATTAAGAGGGIMDQVIQMAPLLLIVVAGYFFMIRPQQQRAKQHQQMVSGVKRGDTVVLSSGLIGKVVRVEDKELGVEIAQNVTVKVVKSMVSDVRPMGGVVAANDAKS